MCLLYTVFIKKTSYNHTFFNYFNIHFYIITLKNLIRIFVLIKFFILFYSFNNKLISFFIKIITKKKIYDTTSGFRAVDKKLIERFASNYPVEYPEPVSTTEVLRLGYRVEEIPVSMNERENEL